MVNYSTLRHQQGLSPIGSISEKGNIFLTCRGGSDGAGTRIVIEYVVIGHNLNLGEN